MEERLIDDPRKIKVKHNAAGGVEDATDGLAPETEEENEDEIYLEIPEGEDALDEDLIGLAPSQLEKELERRKKAAEEAAAERDRLLGEAKALTEAGNFTEAEPLFEQASALDPVNLEAAEGLWRCRTEDYKNGERLLDPALAEEFSQADERVRARALEAFGKKWKEDRAALEAEAAPLRDRVYEAQKERRGAFLANRNYYRLRLAVCLVLLGVLCLAAAVSGQFIVRTTENTPAILTIVFGALAVLDLIPVVFFARKLVVAQRLCDENEKLSSTEEGAVLDGIEEKLAAYRLLLGDPEEK